MYLYCHYLVLNNYKILSSIFMQTYGNGKTTISIYERKASIRQFYCKLKIECIKYEMNVWLSIFSDFLSLLVIKQLLYFLLYCNLRKESQIWKRGNRKKCMLLDTKGRMILVGKENLKLTLKEKRNVEFAWNWKQKLCCLIVVTICVCNVTEIGTFLHLHLRFFPVIFVDYADHIYDIKQGSFFGR